MIVIMDLYFLAQSYMFEDYLLSFMSKGLNAFFISYGIS